MTTLLFLFALLTTPSDRWVCDLWTKTITAEGVAQACGVSLLEGLRLDVYLYEDMSHVCEVDAVYLNDLAELAEICQLRKTLDNYVLRIVEPGYYSIICYVESEHEAPTLEEIAAQCPQARDYVIEFAGTKKPEEDQSFQCPPRDLVTGFGLYQQPADVKELLTSEPYTWLAGQLIWNGLVKAKCLSPVDPKTLIATPCGLAAARQAVNEWQNQFDAEIYSAALAYNVPARLLKRMIGIESQFWPFYTAADGERGVMQITDNGLDVLMRFDGADIDPYYFDRGETGRLWSRAVTRDALVCVDCKLSEAVQKVKDDMPTYARLLAAFHCRAVTINPALEGNLAWGQAVVDYNGSFEYLEKIEQ